MPKKRSSATLANGAVYLQRNRTERKRLQGLQRTPCKRFVHYGSSLREMEKFNVRLINEGGRQTFFAIFLHLLVIAFAIARSAALVPHVDLAFILLPVCRNFDFYLRRTPLNDQIPFDKNIAFHKATAWSMVVFTILHVLAHMVNFYKLATATGQRILPFFAANLGPGITGWIMTISLTVMVFFAKEKVRRATLERFWYSHHLFIIFFINWHLHGTFCMIKPDRAPLCSSNTIGVFWRYWLVGQCSISGTSWNYRSRKKSLAREPVFLSCPEVSYFQWHPFTLTSAPEEDYISVHIRVAVGFRTGLAKAVGCDFSAKGAKGDIPAGGKVVGTNTNHPEVPTPHIMTVLLVGAGIGVTPFASILKSIWLSKVYFTWVICDSERFHSLISRIEINIYLTAKIKEMMDAITSLRMYSDLFTYPLWYTN
ncbi:hypothetical protein BYT27DRAFT_7234265 [Phlegmacium glaucopus]|nr:hypothetical protein BYT27DRAFT_7234265 [Phlegmacium glaucopus]